MFCVCSDIVILAQAVNQRLWPAVKLLHQAIWKVTVTPAFAGVTVTKVSTVKDGPQVAYRMIMMPDNQNLIMVYTLL